jgi:hypothetical protein
VQEAEDLRKCIDDPKKTEATFRSSGSLAGTPMILDIHPGTSESARKTILVKIVGRRFDERSRSASPPLRKNDDGGDTGHDHQRRRRDRDDRIAMPRKVFVDWVPRWNKQQDRIYSWARVRAPRVSFENLHRRTVAETGRAPVQIAEIDLGRRVAECHVSVLQYSLLSVRLIVDCHRLCPAWWTFSERSPTSSRPLHQARVGSSP